MRQHLVFVVTALVTVLFLAPVAPRAQSSTEQQELRTAQELEKAKGQTQKALEIYKKLATSRDPETAAAAKAAVLRLQVQAPGAPPQPGQPVERSIWSGAPPELTLSHDGRFAANMQGGSLAVRDMATGVDRPLVARERTGDVAGFVAGFAAFSRDGKFIAYDWRVERGQEIHDELRVVPTDAPIGVVPTPQTLLVDRATGGFSVKPTDWSPDGAQIAVIIGHPADQTRQIGTVDAKTGELTVLKTTEFRAPTRLLFSPDGAWLAYDAPAGLTTSQRDVFAIDRSTRREVPVALGADQDVLAAWSDTGHVLFVSDRQGASSLWAQAMVAGRAVGSPQLLRADVGRPLMLTSSGTLFHIALESSPRIYTAALDVAGGKLTTPAAAIRTKWPTIGLPAWSPDGKSLAYLSSSASFDSLVFSIQDVSSGRVREALLPVRVIVDNFRWSPDGRWITTSGVDFASQRAIFLINAETLEATVLARPPEGQRFVYPQWCEGGASVCYLDAAGNRTVFTSRNRADGGTSEIFARPRPPVFFGAISPDGRQIASLNDDNSAVTVISLETGDEQEVFRLPVPRSALGGPAAEWTSDGKALLIRISAGGGPMMLWLAPIDRGQPRQVDVGVPGLAGFARLSSRNQLAFSAGVERRELRALENFLPPPVAKR